MHYTGAFSDDDWYGRENVHGLNADYVRRYGVRQADAVGEINEALAQLALKYGMIDVTLLCPAGVREIRFIWF